MQGMVTKVTADSPEPRRDKLSKDRDGQKPWMKHMGKLKHLRKETQRINERTEEAFEQIDPEAWK